jgi:hypothetical protein
VDEAQTAHWRCDALACTGSAGPNLIRLLALVLFALLLASCDDGRAKTYHGALYFGQGAYLMRFSLTDGSISIAGHLGDTSIRQVTALGDDHLLIAEYASVNRGRVSRISWMDPKTGETADLYAGTWTEHLADPGVVVYDDGEKLYAVPQRADSDNEVIFLHPKNPLTSLLEAAPGVLLIETGDTAGAVIHAWDARSGSLRELPGLTASCNLVGAVWIAPRQRLACSRRAGAVGEPEYVLADLEGNIDGRLKLPEGKEFFALSYVESQNTLILQEAWRGWLDARDKHAILVHELDSGESHRVASNVNLGGSIVYANY